MCFWGASVVIEQLLAQTVLLHFVRCCSPNGLYRFEKRESKKLKARFEQQNVY